MQAIIVKYVGPTDTKGTRMKATCEAGSLTISYDSEKSALENAEHALTLLVHKLDWHTRYPQWVGASLGDAWVFVFRNDALTVNV